MSFAVVATFRDSADKMRIVLEEKECKSKQHPDRHVIDLPSMTLRLADEDSAEAYLRGLGYEAGELVFMGSTHTHPAACLARQRDDTTLFLLAPNVQKIEGESTDVHTPDVVTVNGWLSEQTHRDVIIATNVWAGLYLRIAYLTGTKIDQIQ